MRISIFRHLYASAPLMLILATLGWGSNTIAGRLAVGEVSPMMLIFLRWGFVVLLIAAISGRAMMAEWGIIRKKSIMDVNFLTLAIAAFIPLLVGFIWYGPFLFQKPLMKLLGHSEDSLKTTNLILILKHNELLTTFHLHLVDLHKIP